MLSRLLKLLCPVLLFSLLLASMSMAQENPPPITAENADQLVPVQTVGSALPGKLAFSPDGRYILASTSEQTYIYPSEQPDAAPQILPFTDFNFDAEDRLVADGQYWNLDTGLSVGIAPTIRVLPPTENQPNTFVEVLKPGGDTIQVDTGFPYHVLGTAVSDDYSILAVVMRVTKPQWLEPALYLYNLATGSLYAILPENIYGGSLQNLKFIEGSTLLIAEFFWDRSGDGDIFIYNASTGELLRDYSGETGSLSQITPDGKRFSYPVNRSEIVILGHELKVQIPYTPWGEYSSSPPFAVGQSHIGIVDDNKIKVIDFYDATVPPISLAFDKPINRPSRFYFMADDRWLVYLANPISYIWDLQTPWQSPVEINITEGSPQNLSPDFTRYVVRTPYFESNKLIFLDAATNETIVELPSNATLNADMSQAIYWQEGAVILHNIVGGEILTLPVMENYLGIVIAFNRVSATTAFVDEQLTLVTVPNAKAVPVDISPAPDSVDFTADGTEILVNREFRGEDKPPAYLAIRDTRSGEEVRELTSTGIYASRLISPTGKYVIDDDSYGGCDSDYGTQVIRLFSAEGDGSAPLIYVNGPCGKGTMAFTNDDTTFYVGYDLHVFAFKPDLLAEVAVVSWDDEPEGSYSILNYIVPAYATTNYYIRDITLSSNQSRIAVLVEGWKNNQYPPAEVRAEIFDLNKLSTGTRRTDIQPLSIITDATIATFSPDGNYIATNVGLFIVGSDKGAKAIDGTISAFTSDSQLLATYQDGYVNLWNVPDPSAITFPVAQYAIKGVRELAFSPDNRYLYIVREGDVQMWGVK